MGSINLHIFVHKIMIPQNPFPVWREFVDLTKYRKLIDKSITQITNDFKRKYIPIEVEKVKDEFWNLVWRKAKPTIFPNKFTLKIFKKSTNYRDT